MAWGVTGPAESASFKWKDCGGTIQSGACPVVSPGQVSLAWDRPTQYTDASLLFGKTFILRYGTSSGVYPNAIDMTGDSDPAMISRVVTGLDIGTTYYFVVQTVDSEGFVSAQSVEFSSVAGAAPVIVDPTPTDTITQSDLPLAITVPGVYQITESLNWDTVGSAITVDADNVTIYAATADNIVFTVGTTVDASGIESLGQNDGLTIHGFHLTTGGHLTTTSTAQALIYTSNSGRAIDNLLVRDMEFTIGVSDANMTGTSSAYGAIVFRSPVGIGIIGDIYNCTFNLRGTKAGSGIRGVSLESGGSAPYLKVYDNQFNCSDCSGTSTGYQRPIQGAHEVYGNTIDVTDCVFTGFGIVGINNFEYSHGNTFTITNSNATRGVMMENDSTDKVCLYNAMNVVSTTGSGDCRLYRVRFGANNNNIGFSDFDGGSQSLGLACVDIYGTQVQYGDTRNNNIYHNSASNSQHGIVSVREQVEDTYLWSNDAGTGNVYGIHLRSISSGENANGMYLDGDTLSGSTADIRLQTDGAFPACEATHFFGVGSVTVSNNDPAETVEETDYWLPGDAGLIQHNRKNTGTKTPEAPTNLRAA